MMREYCLMLVVFLSACTITGNAVVEIVNETSQEPIKVYFCGKDDCGQKFAELFSDGNEINCAFYSLKSEKLSAILNEKNARLVAESSNKKDFKGLNAKLDWKKGLMHNKFCVIDASTVITGSWNPAEKTRTANNMVIIPSRFVANNYEDEFEEMSDGNFGGGGKVRHPLVNLNGKLVETYFCPEDNCQRRVLESLDAANQSIYFMTYSFTDEEIGNKILEKSRALQVKGIFDSSQLSEWSQYSQLQEFSIVKKGIHHKVFIIDGKRVIFGSYNPTKNGNKVNDENIIILHDEEISQKFIEEFNSLLA